ncbi:MAG: carboxypeptidase regulatory-like domain-containing protein, partial [Acidobacteria bacterium]|nr:carboxypeptidase regulatory-like domain-containing protein [Acidobacteriota bacterium]
MTGRLRCMLEVISLPLVLYSSLLMAQTFSGSVSGTVVDGSGAAIPGSTVTLVNEKTGEPRTAATTESGDFIFTALQPGVYTIKVQREGFRSFQRTANVVTSGDRLSLGKLELAVGARAEFVTVTAQGATVATGSSDNSALLTSKQVEMIGVRGRDVVSLLALLPGVDPGSISTEAPGGAIGYGSSIPQIQGNRSTWNSISLDGLIGTNPGVGNALGSSVSLDAVSEVKVLLNTYQAEYGRNIGATINIVTKSGSQEFHGAGFWYKRHEMFNANNFFNNQSGIKKPPYRYTTLGGTLGGPLYLPGLGNRVKQKTFFFYSLEHWESQAPQPLQRWTMPTELERAGNFSQTLDVNNRLIAIRDSLSGQPFPDNLVPPTRIDRNGRALLGIFPLPNAPDRQTSKGNYNYLFQESYDMPRTQHLLRLDHRFSDTDAVYLRLSRWASDATGYGVNGSSPWPLFATIYQYTDTGLVLNHTRIFSPRVVNEFSLSGHRSTESISARAIADQERLLRSNIGMDLGQFHPEINPLNLIPRASFAGVPSAPSIIYDKRFPLRGGDTFITLTDGLTVNAGTHLIKAGIYLESALWQRGNNGTYMGEFAFGRDVNNPLDTTFPFSNALLGAFTSYSESTSWPRQKGSMWACDWFVQDTWKATRNLTVDVGFRFGWYTWWKKADGQIAAFALDRYSPSNGP